MRDNTTIFVGTATEPELRFTATGTAFAKFAISLYEGKNDDGTYRDSTWVDIIVWGEQAEQVAESVQKGTRVGVLGRIKQNRWETDDGQKRSKLECVADEVMVSLRWANVTVVKISQSSSGAGYGGGKSTPAPAPSEDPFL